MYVGKDGEKFCKKINFLKVQDNLISSVVSLGRKRLDRELMVYSAFAPLLYLFA